MRSKSPKMLLVFCLFMSAFPVFSQKRTYTTQHVNPHPPTIDGRLDDPAWASVPWGDTFTQREPYDGKDESQRTAFKILYDDKNVYVAIRAYDTEPEKITRRMTRRDEVDGDFVGIQFDSYNDHRTAFTFLVSAAGVRMDGVFTNDGDNEDWSPDPVWRTKTSVDSGGWSAEMQISLSQLRFGNQENHVWGLQVARQLYRKEELACWQHIPQDAPGWVHQFGELHGISGIKPPRRVELMPYSRGRMELMEKESGNPFVPGRLSDTGFGLDAKIGVTSDLTLDLTVNPDFGQVEADPSVVNLTAFETFYDEKRPFFIEGNNILDYSLMIGDGDFSNDNLFYSRRIGRQASHDPDTDDGEHVKMPENSSIISAAKLTGKTKSGISIGLMDAVTARESAEIDLSGSRRFKSVEPMTNYFLGRVQKDFNQGNTIIGGIVTNTNRDIRDAHLKFLHKSATTGGLDFLHQWQDKTYSVTLTTAFSHVRGTEEAITRTQRASARYYQRPDADYVALDSSRTSLSGHSGTFAFNRAGQGHFQFGLGGTWRSPGLALNDMGYLHRGDVAMEFVWAQYRIWEPFSIFRSFSINFNQWAGWNFGGQPIFDGGNINWNVQFKNYWGAGGGIGFNGRSLSASALRGGPSLLFPSQWNSWLNLRTDSKKAFQFSVNGSFNRSEDRYSRSYNINPSVRWRPNNAVSLFIQPFYSVNHNDLQYVDTVDDTETDRYIFGRIDQKTLGWIFRLDYSITPSRTIQFYGQPFISAGNYSRLKRITSPRAETYADRFHAFTGDEIAYDADDNTYQIQETGAGAAEYTVDNPDFNFRQFRSNLVVRWEYLPGSTIYLVWSQGRTEEVESGVFSYSNDMRGLFGVYPYDVFLIKINRWFSL